MILYYKAYFTEFEDREYELSYQTDKRLLTKKTTSRILHSYINANSLYRNYS